MPTPTLVVIQSGPFSTLQDLGRRGRGHQGVARSGAFDQRSHRLANRLVGNDVTSASLEILFGPCELAATDHVVVAVTGTHAQVTITSSDGATRHEGVNSAFLLRAGQRLLVGVPSEGLRTYLSVRGGFDVPPVLGSRSFDSLGLIGPSPLKLDATLTIGTHIVDEAWFETVPLRQTAEDSLVDLRLGPRHDWLSDEALATIADMRWTIDAASNRTGVRFAGPKLFRRDDELASEAMIPGAVQLPLSGLPIVLGPDGGTTGGYPVIGVVPQSGLDHLAQRRPGDRVGFRVLPAGR